jgi:alkylation response protein AidB-like acyl-CoA dehydrogenase
MRYSPSTIIAPRTKFLFQVILNQEFARPGMRGFQDGLLAGTVIGLPPVLNFGNPELKKKVVDEVFSGKKLVCLAISEAFAGSDVSGLKTVARKTSDGKHWIINGTKKWITNGVLVAISLSAFFVLNSSL